MSEFYCVCQSKNGRTGFCNVIPKYQEELEVYKKALDMVCQEFWNDYSDCENCPVKNNNDKCDSGYCGVTSYDLANYYLQKARTKER